MISALYSKDRAEKAAFISAFAAGSAGPVIYVAPKNMGRHRLRLPGVHAVTYEEVMERDTWLRTNALIGPNTSLIFENPSRYPKATTPKSRALRRLSMQITRKALVDIVPFTVDVKYLYTPLSYLDRAILGYAHNYAFLENYQELGEDGAIRLAHEPAVLAEKMRSVCRISYNGFLCPQRTTIPCPVTPDEHAMYMARRAELFATETSPQRIITRLADTAHAFSSRTAALLALLPELEGPVMVYTNLSSYAQKVERAARQAGFLNVSATSYQLGAGLDAARHTVYFESPIINSHYLLDIEAAIPPIGSVWHFLSDTKVDAHLYGQIDRELTQIEALTRELHRVSC